MEQMNKKQTYNNKVCEFCVNKTHCTKDKFTTKEINGRTTMRCYGYVFDFQNKK